MSITDLGYYTLDIFKSGKHWMSCTHIGTTRTWMCFGIDLNSMVSKEKDDHENK
jgi:hypothetical protein